ncbi:MAG: UDP-N-acetylmuramoyl-L-alanyl-D-glutamate--2,6-diaminopimelate ligase [Alphaproteobacteria bacterium]|nr:UDP-N-acetylmuramoyl-L-alanyl-D-glutamate--2,6-diaminopimelate ligase [Alphaproteobacteria bacterium]
MQKLPKNLCRNADSLPTVEITGIAIDSRQVKQGDLFIAIPGAKTDGAQFAQDAKAKGVAAVAGKGMEIDTPEPRRFAALAAAAWFGAQPEALAAVTGTDGKTSTAHFLRQMWAAMGKKAVSIGTLGVVEKDAALDYPKLNTTPDPVLLQRVLAEVKQSGVTHAVMEASSIGIEQHRMDGVKVKAAAFTNLTPEHLDYHKNMESYFSCKARLFTELLDGAAVINADDAYGARLVPMCRKAITFGEKEGVDLRLERIAPQPEGIALKLDAFGKGYEILLPVYGHFQAWNIVTAIGLAHACGATIEEAVAAAHRVSAVPGRLEKVIGDKAVFVDYAHTPGALRNVLTALRAHTKGKLGVVFGCGGDRDAMKREPMGKIAAELADAVIVTDDNPRSESPEAIRAAVKIGCPDAEEIGDRREAIRHAVRKMREGDVLVIAGKGHEKEQIVGSRVLPFDDVKEAEDALKEVAA